MPQLVLSASECKDVVAVCPHAIDSQWENPADLRGIHLIMYILRLFLGAT